MTKKNIFYVKANKKTTKQSLNHNTMTVCEIINRLITFIFAVSYLNTLKKKKKTENAKR